MRGGGAGQLHHRIRAADGMVTAEYALALLATVPLMLSVVLLTGAAAAQVQVLEVARTAARMLARGDAQADVRAHVTTVLPSAGVEIEYLDEDVVVTVRRSIRAGGLLPQFTVHGTAVTPVEAVR